MKSYIKDTIDFLTKLPESTDPYATLVTFDVESLYTNIQHTLGLDAIKFWLEKHPEDIPSRINKNFILEGIKLILENNYFCFNNEFYLHVKCPAMGTKVAPIYSTLVLTYLEEKKNFISGLKGISISHLVSILKKTSKDFLMTASSYLQNQIMNWRNYINI